MLWTPEIPSLVRLVATTLLWTPEIPLLVGLVATTLLWTVHYEKLVAHVEPHASAVSLLKRAENSAI